MRLGSKHTDEAKRKTSASCKGRVPWNKGVKMSEESKKKLSESLKKKWATEEYRTKLSEAHMGQTAWNKGVSMSEESKRKVSETKKKQNRKHTKEFKRYLSKINSGENNAFYGRTHTEETKKRIALHFIGEKCNFWRGGIAQEPYCNAWGDKNFKEDIKERDNYGCQNEDCWGTSDKLCVHHIDYNKKNCHPRNLITLCVSCNARANSNRTYWTEYYTNRLVENNPEMEISGRRKVSNERHSQAIRQQQ